MVEDDAAWSDLHHAGVIHAVHVQGAAHQHGAVGTDGMLIVGHQGFVLAGVDMQGLVGGLLLLLGQGRVGGHELLGIHDGLGGQAGVAGVFAPDGLGALLGLAHAVHSQVVGTQHHVLGGHGDGTAVLRT